MDKRIVELTDSWLGAEAPRSNVAVSSRTRYARNLAGFPFVPHARAEVLERVSKYLHEAIGRSPLLRQFERVELATLSSQERSLLKETRLISKEMENGGSNLAAYLSPDGTGSILVNEEDHVRLQVITPGLQVAEALRRL
ncbi:ATP--guanido phosphotransferase, partial [Candidatus Poribacteria bacterium]|nr:ATP--guanido phosphotransferase [Candidatus Poribacteria bacterium]